MTIAASAFRPANRAERRRQNHFRNNSLDRPEAFSFAVTRMQNFGNSQNPIPQQIVLLRPNPSDSSQDQLFLDQVPLPRDAWRYDSHDLVLTWKGAFGGGHLFFDADGRGAFGNIGSINPCSVKLSFTAKFLCDVALDCGVEYVSSGSVITGLKWDPSSTAWKNATWVLGRLAITYTYKMGCNIDPGVFTVDLFEDKATGAIWPPSLGAYTASLTLGTRNSQTVFEFSFKTVPDPAPDTGSSSGPDSVFPYYLQAFEDAAAANIDGAFVIDGAPGAAAAKLVGLKGVRASALATGYYRTTESAAPFGVFDGRLMIAGQAVAGSFMSGRVLKWQGLDPAHQKRTGLPESGFLQFTQNGAMASNGDSRVTARRLPASVAIQAIAAHRDLHSGIHDGIATANQALLEGKLQTSDLLVMTPFVVNKEGFYDTVQEKVREDLSTIMNSYIPGDLWTLLFSSTPQPTLTGNVAIVANSPVSGVTSPTDWYKGLATAVLTQGLARGSDDNCKYMNGPRAAAWLKSQVATSPVYHAHGQLLFHYHWKELWPHIADFLDDQQNTDHTADIKLITDDATADYNTNVKPADSDLLAKIQAQITEMDTTAKTNKLYWAYAFWHYTTSAACLATLAMQMQTGADPSAMSRQYQQILTVLTSLDPSGYFSRKYAETINIFLSVNVLPTMCDLKGDGPNADLIQLYLQQFVDNNINNPDDKIKTVAAKIKDILDAKGLQPWMDALREFAGSVMSWDSVPTIAYKWSNWLSNNYPTLHASGEAITAAFFAGVTGLATFNLILQCKRWDKLQPDEKAAIVVNACQLGLEMVTAVAVKGVRIYALFGVEGLSKLGRLKALGKIIVLSDVEEILQPGLLRLGNNFARWIAGSEGVVAKLSGGASEYESLTLKLNNIASDAEEADYVAMIFGDSLEEFMARRLGPVLILAGIGLSLYFIIAHHEQGIPLAADIINIVGGALALFATFGGWYLAAYEITEGALASCVAVAGPLAILAALVGIALLLYEMFKKQPNPVQEFLDQYVKKSDFYVSSTASSIDYAIPYALKDVKYGPNKDKKDDLMMLGFSLASGSQKNLICNADGSIGANAPGEPLPAGIWQADTNGSGISRIFTVVKRDSSSHPIVLFLTLMNDQSVSFQPVSTKANAAAIKTQHWLSAPQSEAETTPDHDLASIQLKFQPVLPDTDGNFLPANAKGWLATTGSGVKIDDSNGSVFVLTMSPIAPNFASMPKLSFLRNTAPSTSLSWGSSFGVPPSTPLTFDLSGDALPSFLAFDNKLGTLAPTGGNTGTTAATTTHELTIKNEIVNSNYGGKEAKVSFTVAVAAT